jgi:hypothetical protein
LKSVMKKKMGGGGRMTLRVNALFHQRHELSQRECATAVRCLVRELLQLGTRARTDHISSCDPSSYVQLRQAVVGAAEHETQVGAVCGGGGGVWCVGVCVCGGGGGAHAEWSLRWVVPKSANTCTRVVDWQHPAWRQWTHVSLAQHRGNRCKNKADVSQP